MKTANWLGIATGALAVWITTAVSAMLALQESFWLWGIGAIAFFVATFAVSISRADTSWVLPIAVAVGIAVGTMLEAMYQLVVGGPSRNVWPIGIVIWWVLGAVPIVCSFLAGRRISRSRR